MIEVNIAGRLGSRILQPFQQPHIYEVGFLDHL